MTLIETTPRKPRRKPAGESAGIPATSLATTTADRILESATRAADELAKLNASMDRLLIATGNGVIPAVRDLAEHLISFLDTADGWDEREHEDEDADFDDEPILGAAEVKTGGLTYWNQERAWKETGQEGEDPEGDELEEVGETDELERGEADGSSNGTVDDEPSLGSLDGRMSQLKWGIADRWEPGTWEGQDCEDDGLVRGEGSGDDSEGCEVEDEVQGRMHGGDRDGDGIWA